MQVDTNVSEADVGRVRVDQSATFTVDAYPGRTFTGTVTSIREAPINVQNVITYDAVIGVSNPDLALFPGMTANVKILVAERRNAVRIPNAALRYRPPSTLTATPRASTATTKANSMERAVWILDSTDAPKRVAITIGETDGAFTEVTGGSLQSGDRLIVAAIGKTAQASEGRPAGPGRGPGF
jgi:HlyD family secretion protein